MTIMNTGRIALVSILVLLWHIVHAKESISQEVDCKEGDAACPACIDLDNDCMPLVEDNVCLESPAYMSEFCRASCGFCSDETDDEDDIDEDLDSQDWFLDMGVPQKLSGVDGVDRKDFYEIYLDAIMHLISVAQSPELYPMLKHCKNNHAMCTQWAMAGNCDENNVYNEHFMNMECCPVCGSASQKRFLMECPIDPDGYTAFEKPGDVTKHFERTIQEFSQYNPQVLSRPSYVDGDSKDTADYKIGPWIITLDGVATDEEMERLIYWGHKFGYERSTDGGDASMDGSWEAVETEDRTSSETFCDGLCETDPIIQGLMKRIENVTGIPEAHSDYLQLLHYTEGQFYKTHQDYHSHQVFSSTGARILTFYIYLNDVESGGGTNFPYLDLTIMPKKGRVAMWANVLDEDPMEEHLLARHQALPVESGEKYGATAWFHHRDYMNNNPDLCGR